MDTGFPLGTDCNLDERPMLSVGTGGKILVWNLVSYLP